MTIPTEILGDDCYLDHVAIATKDLEKSVSIFSDLGLKFDEKREVVESQKVKTAFAHIDTKAHLELLGPTSDDGPIAKFLKKNGPGIHHLCFHVTDVHKKADELRAKGFVLLYETAQAGAGGAMVNFIHPKSTGGVLIEISTKEEKK